MYDEEEDHSRFTGNRKVSKISTKLTGWEMLEALRMSVADLEGKLG